MLIPQATTMLGVAVEVALKGTLLMAAAWAVVFALRGATASFKHLVWSSSLVAMLAIPALMLVLPRWNVGLLPEPGAPLPVAVETPAIVANVEPDAVPIQQAMSQAEAAPGIPTDRVSPITNRRSSTSSNSSSSSSFAYLWLGGVLVGLITIAGGLLTLRRLAHAASPATGDAWLAIKENVSDDLDLNRDVEILISPAAVMPATWGVFHPVVLLPADANEWTTDRKRVVLLHELAHVKRNDCLSQLIAQLACAIYWFHPLVWYTARQLRKERELACDEQVLGVGINACDYATHLLEIASLSRAPQPSAVAAIAMARPSQLAGRIQAILDENAAEKWRTSRLGRAVIVSMLAVTTLPIAAMRPWRDLTPPVVSNPRDNFEWKGQVPRGKWVEVLSQHSEMRAELSKTNEVVVQAERKEGNASAYRVAMENDRNGLRFCVVAAASYNRQRPCATEVGGSLKNGIDNVRVDFVIKVPAGVGLAMHTTRGNIAAEGMQSYIWGTADRGDIAIETTDLAEASTSKGSISAEFGRRSWKQDLEFLTDSGDVTVVAPNDATMMIEAETSAGRVRSEFPGTVRRFGAGQRIDGATGKGGMLTLRTGRGIVEIKRGKNSVAELSDMSSDSNAPLSSSFDPKPNPNPDPDPDINPNPNLDSSFNPNPNPDPGYNPNPDAENSQDNPTGELVPVSVPGDLIQRFSDAKIAGARDAAVIRRFRDIAATHVKQHAADLVRERSEWVLTLVRNGSVMNALVESLRSDDWRVRAYAAWALGETREKSAEAPLTAALTDRHWRVRMHAAAGLQRIAGPNAVAPLIAALTDESWQVRMSAVDALGAIGDARALQPLQSLADRDPRWMVRDQASNAIRRLK